MRCTKLVVCSTQTPQRDVLCIRLYASFPSSDVWLGWPAVRTWVSWVVATHPSAWQPSRPENLSAEDVDTIRSVLWGGRVTWHPQCACSDTYRPLHQSHLSPPLLVIQRSPFKVGFHNPFSVHTLRAVCQFWGEVTIPLLSEAAAKSFQSCPTLCDPIDGSPPGSPDPGILQARVLEWVAISFSNKWKWKVKGKSLSSVQLLATPWTAAYQAPPSMGFSRQEYWSGVPLPSPYQRAVHFLLSYSLEHESLYCLNLPFPQF